MPTRTHEINVHTHIYSVTVQTCNVHREDLFEATDGMKVGAVEEEGAIYCEWFTVGFLRKAKTN